MITWMQRHKKYLIITIWISTIAFVGAGFVGWGAYTYGSRANNVAKVGKIDISLKDLQTAYSNLYSYYNRIFQGKLDQEKAKSLGLENQALSQLLTEAILLNFAKELGLTVLDSEVQQKIIGMREFQKNGSFDKETYLSTLKMANLRAKDFEESLRKQLLIEKVSAIIQPKTTPLEKEAIGAALFVADKLKYTILPAQSVKVDATEEEIKAFWEGNKNSYMAEPIYELEVLWQSSQEVNATDEEIKAFWEKNSHKYKNSEGKLLTFEEARKLAAKDLALESAKKEALKKYLAFKKNEISADEKLVVQPSNALLPQDLMNQIKISKEGDYIKPHQVGERFVVVKLLKKVPSRVMEFEGAKEKAKEDLLRSKRAQKFQELAKTISQGTFEGTVTDFLARDDLDKIEGLTKEEAAEFLDRLFEAKSPKGYILLENKAIIYEILSQKLYFSGKIEKNNLMIDDNSLKLKSNMINSSLIEGLKTRYPIEIYYKGQ